MQYLAQVLSANDISLLQWQCAGAYVFRRQPGYALSKSQMQVVRKMRRYFRADERPPHALVLKAMSIVSQFKARRRGFLPTRTRNTDRKERPKAARTRMPTGKTVRRRRTKVSDRLGTAAMDGGHPV